MITLAGITLPPYLLWEDEFSWSPVEQETGYSVTGSLLLDISTKLAGRPVTLVGTEHLGWILRAQLLELQTLADTPAIRELNYHERIFSTRFRYDNGAPVTAEKIIPRIPPRDTDPYRNLKIQLIIVG
jgi:hypothetical protein